jgi:hypothetical protein
MKMSGNDQPQTGPFGDEEMILYLKLMEKLNALTMMAITYFNAADPTIRLEVTQQMMQLADAMRVAMKAGPGGGTCPDPTWTDCGNYCVPPGMACS